MRARRMNKMISLMRYYWRRIICPATINKDTRDFLRDVIFAHLPQAPVIVEAGAYKGWDTIEMAKTWPRGRIYAFEPVPKLFSVLLRTARRYNNIHCIQMALGERAGSVSMYISSGGSDGSSSLMKPKAHLIEVPDTFFDKTITVASTTLDDWAAKQQVDKCDFLWLDMQGAELAAIKASPRIVATVRVIYLEVSRTEIYAGCPLYPEVRAYLEAIGFRVALEEFASASWGNVMFVRTSDIPCS